MPTQLFYSVTIPVTLWFISRNKKQTGKTLFIDARNMGHMVDRKHRDFSEEDINRLADTFTAFQNGTLEDVKGFCATVKTEDIAKQDYILTPGRYVGIEEKAEDDEPFDEKMKRLTTELSGMFAKSHELEEEIKKILQGLGGRFRACPSPCSGRALRTSAFAPFPASGERLRRCFNPSRLKHLIFDYFGVILQISRITQKGALCI